MGWRLELKPSALAGLEGFPEGLEAGLVGLEAGLDLLNDEGRADFGLKAGVVLNRHPRRRGITLAGGEDFEEAGGGSVVHLVCLVHLP